MIEIGTRDGGSNEHAASIALVPVQPSVEAAGVQGGETLVVCLAIVETELRLAAQELALIPSRNPEHDALHLRDGCQFVAVEAAGVAAPGSLPVAPRVRVFKAVEPVCVCQPAVEAVVILHLRHEQVEGRKGHDQPHKVQHRRQPEAACHVSHVPQYRSHSYYTFYPHSLTSGTTWPSSSLMMRWA